MRVPSAGLSVATIIGPPHRAQMCGSIQRRSADACVTKVTSTRVGVGVAHSLASSNKSDCGEEVDGDWSAGGGIGGDGGNGIDAGEGEFIVVRRELCDLLLTASSSSRKTVKSATVTNENAPKRMMVRQKQEEDVFLGGFLVGHSRRRGAVAVTAAAPERSATTCEASCLCRVVLERTRGGHLLKS